MPKLPRVSSRHVIKVLTKLGYVETRSRGSHHRFNSNSRGPATVPNYSEIGPKLLKSILNQAGLSDEEFVKLLNK